MERCDASLPPTCGLLPPCRLCLCECALEWRQWIDGVQKRDNDSPTEGAAAFQRMETSPELRA